MDPGAGFEGSASGLSISGGSVLVPFEDAAKLVYHNGTAVSGHTIIAGEEEEALIERSLYISITVL